MITAFATLARRRMHDVRADGDRGSLVLAMLVTLVATSVAALVLPLLLTSANAARFDDRRARQLTAARSGVEASIARIRDAATGSIGSRALLPCTVSGTVLGSVDLRYRSTVTYYAKDPATLVGTALDAAVVRCLIGSGTITTPAFARITALGTDTPGTAWTGISSRSVSATYILRTTAPNLSAGNLRVSINKATRTLLCLTADSANPTAGSAVRTAVCDATASAQLFAYTPALTLTLVSSRTAATPAGLCISSPPGVAQAVNGSITLQPCDATRTQQQWSFNYLTQWEGTNDGLATDGLVVHPLTDAAGSQLTLRKSGDVANTYIWDPDYRVGAGAAGATRHNLVNFGQFGRCLDITNFQVNLSYMISWPCKQSPAANEPTNWNQRWYWTDPGASGPVTAPIYTVAGSNVNPSTSAGKTFCLTDPGAVNGKVTMVTCDPTAPAANQKWRVIGTSGANYSVSYRIESPDGTRCLAAKDAALEDFAEVGTKISKIIVAACSSSPLQKWNAPADASAATVKDQTEN